MNATFDLSKPIVIGGDHAGFDYKQEIISHFEKKGFTFKDYGTFSKDSVDYPDFAHPVAEAVASGQYAFGILICGSANGVAITANKHQHIRAGLAWEKEVAQLIRQHNAANIICIPSRFAAIELALEMVETFMNTAFEGGRHEGRVNKIACI